MATEGELRLLARVTALEILMQHIIVAACGDHQQVREFRTRVMDDLAKSTIPKAGNPATSDLLMQLLEEAATETFDATERRFPLDRA